jgi:nitrogen fixation protein NifU and related proteins
MMRRNLRGGNSKLPPGFVIHNPLFWKLMPCDLEVFQLPTACRTGDTSTVYSAKVLDHFEHPRNAGSLVDAQATIEVANPVCGDVLELSAIAAEGRISSARFHARGCVTAVACASVLTELIAGKTRGEISNLSAERISAELDGLPPATFHGAQLAMDALAELLRQLKF